MLTNLSFTVHNHKIELYGQNMNIHGGDQRDPEYFTCSLEQWDDIVLEVKRMRIVLGDGKASA